ncbi:MAG: catechol 2,3-dioxygenase-like lactoylglutathione lyase family enzyme [Alphaproteobacteria bacterium]|jgi:catechol 2,3-dioxygenase-like lactoylglutathione lyase family enzyme
MAETTTRVKSAIKSRFISHGTLGSKDLVRSRKFYEEFLGLEVVQTSKISLMIRLGGHHVYAVVKSAKKPVMDRLFHNGVDVETVADVDESYQTVLDAVDEWGLYDISRPVEQHGTYSFSFWDMDDNCWEILSNPARGYTWIFEQGDLDGRGHFERGFHTTRPDGK